MVDQVAGIEHFTTCERGGLTFRYGGNILTVPTPSKKAETFDAFPNKI